MITVRLIQYQTGELVSEWNTDGAFPRLGEAVENRMIVRYVRWTSPSIVELHIA
jgi:hypothetical protein